MANRAVPDAGCLLQTKIAYMEFQDAAKQKIQRIKNRPHPNWELMSDRVAINEIRWFWDMLIAVVNCAKYTDNSQNIISSALTLCDERLVGMPDTPMSREVREMLEELKKVKSY